MYFTRIASLFTLSAALVSASPFPRDIKSLGHVVDAKVAAEVASVSVNSDISARASVELGKDVDVEVSARDVAGANVSVTDALNTLKATTDSVLPQITALAGNITEEAVAPLIQQLVDAVNTTVTSLSSVTSTSAKRDAGGDVANLLAGLLNDVASTLNPITAELEKLPVVSELITTLGPLLQGVLSTVESLIPGVLSLVAGLVNTATGLLSALGLGGILSTLNL